MGGKKKYLNFANDNNSCWIDAVMILIANNKKFQKTVESSEDSHINKIISNYNGALDLLNTSSDARRALKQARAILCTLQRTTINYLQEFLKFKIGDPESAFCAFLNLICQDNSPIKDRLNTTWIWNKECRNCNESTKSMMTKPIITLTDIKKFNPESPICWYICTCKSKGEMKVEFVEISECLIFHFENGAGRGKNIPFHFFIKQRGYNLTSIIMYEESEGSNKDHFVSWIRQPFTGKWLECNDLDHTLVYFSNVKPELKRKNIYLVVYETFDNLTKTKLEPFSFEDAIDSSIKEIELIDLSTDEENSLLNCSSNKEMKMKTLSSNDKSAKQKSVRKVSVNSNETETISKDEVESKSMVKLGEETLHNENKTSKDTKTNIVKNIESLSSSNESVTPKKSGMVKSKIVTYEKDLKNLHPANANAAENSYKVRKINKNSDKKPYLDENDKKRLRELIDNVVGNTYSCFIDSLCKERMKNTDTSSPKTEFATSVDKMTNDMSQLSVSDAKSATSNVMDRDKK